MALPHNLITRLFNSGIQNGNLPQVYSTLAGNAYLTKDHIASVVASTLSEKQGNRPHRFRSTWSSSTQDRCH